MCSITPASYPKTSRISGEFREPLVEVGKFPSPPHFSWKPSDETEGGGRKRNALCVRVCVIHVSCLGLTASLPCVKSFSSRGLIFSWSVFFYRSSSVLYWNISSLCPLEVCLGSFCICAVETFRWLFFIRWLCFLALSAGCVLLFVDLLPRPSPVWIQWCVLLSLDLWWHLQMFRGVDETVLRLTKSKHMQLEFNTNDCADSLC